jgi:hypothetical protein
MNLADENVELTRKCLTLISRIAARAAASPDCEHVVDTLMELTFALEPHPSAIGSSVTHRSLSDLRRIHETLDFIDSTSQGFTAGEVLKYALRSTWN